ncbi:MAG TPA: TrkH family potassium uptake protein, partial [Firmicutes bacterium]|nr:TrkH family potassium uptake protein [Bacillota bacterium]
WPLIEGGDDLPAFLWSVLLTTAAGGGLYLLFSPYRPEQLTLMESFSLVALAWFMAGLCGALPYYFYGLFEGSYLGAFFESISGFTTTGATLIGDIESLPRGLLFWRSFTQWLGGMGIIVLSVAILPRFGFRSTAMFKAELPGPISERVVPRLVETARRLWLIYLALTALQTILLLISGVSFFNSLAHALTTMPTGGFSTFNASVASLENPAAEGIITLFMFGAGINFVLYYRLFKGDVSSVKENEELRFYFLTTAAAIVLICINIYPHLAGNALEVLRTGAFQVVSIVTTTGYATANFDVWPHFARVLLFFLMFTGACGGSTGGAIKQVRLLILLKYAYRELYQMVHPSAVSSIKLGGHPLSGEIIRGVVGFSFLYILFFVLSTLALSGMGLDFITSASAVASTLGNVGPGLGQVGPMFTYQVIPPAGIALLSIMMILGRLEIYTVLVLALPAVRHFVRGV